MNGAMVGYLPLVLAPGCWADVAFTREGQMLEVARTEPPPAAGGLDFTVPPFVHAHRQLLAYLAELI